LDDVIRYFDIKNDIFIFSVYQVITNLYWYVAQYFNIWSPS